MGRIALAAGVLCVVTRLLPTDAAGAVLLKTWPILLFLAFIKLVADLCDDAGLFDVAAHLAAKVGRGHVLGLFLTFCATAIVATWVLSLDTTAVLLTPVALALAAELDVPAWPFAIASVWIANAASLLLPVSNLTNLLAQDHLGIGSLEFVALTWKPQLAVLVVTIVVLVVRHRSSLAGRYDVPSGLRLPDRVPLLAAAGVAGLTGPAIVAGAPAWTVALAGTAILVVAFLVRDASVVRPRRLISLVPWDMIALAVGLFLVVETVVLHVHPWLVQAVGPPGDGIYALGRLAFGGGIAANLLNNLPAYLVLEPFAPDADRLVTLLTSVNVAPVVLIWGSLANLLWREVCQARGVEVSVRRFALEGLLLVPAAVLAAVLVIHA